MFGNWELENKAEGVAFVTIGRRFANFVTKMVFMVFARRSAKNDSLNFYSNVRGHLKSSKYIVVETYEILYKKKKERKFSQIGSLVDE